MLWQESESTHKCLGWSFIPQKILKEKKNDELWIPFIPQSVDRIGGGEVRLMMMLERNQGGHKLSVTVIGAKNLMAKDATGLSNPTIALTLLSKQQMTFLTTTQSNSINPVFHESHTL